MKKRAAPRQLLKKKGRLSQATVLLNKVARQKKALLFFEFDKLTTGMPEAAHRKMLSQRHRTTFLSRRRHIQLNTRNDK
jgi:hypothetical protein